jgi:hypothetical protein
VRSQLDRHPQLAQKVEQWQQQYPLPLTGSTRITTDDWPYIYLKGPSIPTLYFLLALLLVALVAYGRLRLGPPRSARRWGSADWHFFLLGAGFLLLEVQNISKASVVIGNTWLVNAVIVSGILVMILLANAIKARWSVPAPAVSVCLIGSCLALYWLDLSTFAFLPFVPKALLVGTLTTLPMLFSGIIFIESLTLAEDKDRALGANLLGALVGGIVQTITFVTGVRALLLVVAGLYAAALLLRPAGRARPARDSRRRESSRPDAELAEPLAV